jgi:hypothetical protein
MITAKTRQKIIAVTDWDSAQAQGISKLPKIADKKAQRSLPVLIIAPLPFHSAARCLDQKDYSWACLHKERYMHLSHELSLTI